MLNKIRKNLFILLIVVCAIQFSYWGVFEPLYGVLRVVIILITVLLFLTSNLKNLVNDLFASKLVKYHLSCSLLFLLICVIYYGIGLVIDFSVIRDILTILGIVLIAFTLNFTEDEIKRVFFIYALAFLFSILSIVFFLGSGFEILDLYLPVPKNQLGPGYAMGAILSLYSIFNDKKRAKWYLAFLFFYIISLLVLRSRATIVATFIVSLLILNIELKHKKALRLGMYFLIGIALVYGSGFIYNAMFKNFDTSSIDSLSTGRMQRNIDGLLFLNDNLFLGETFGGSYGGKIIHNYLLKNIVAFGAIAFIPLALIYFKYLRVALSQAFRNKKDNYFRIGNYLVLFLFIISLFEYSFPFSPVSATFFAFIVFSSYLKNN